METITNKQLWENVLVEVELAISKSNFKMWFRDTHIVRREDGVVVVGVPSEFVKDWLSQKYHKMILKALRDSFPAVRSTEFVVSKSEKHRDRPEEIRTPYMGNELPLDEHYINRNDNLNPRYTFDTFVVGPFNELAHAASQAVIQRPGIMYNPLFIYGSTGYGKTHLIQAIGNQVKKMSPSKKVFYVTSEKYAIDYLAALQAGTMNAFKEKYRQYDVLIMDDIQFFSQKERTQEELFHLFNALYENNKQIVFSSDKHPNYIQNLEERLKSRFSQGMIVDISEPDRESRIVILRTKAGHNNFILSDEILEHVADTVQGNIRDLEGSLNSIICQTHLKGTTLSLGDVRQLIKNGPKPKKTISIREVVKKVAEFYNIEENSIYEKTRKKEVVKPRQLIMYILREDFSVSYPTIGQKLGGRDHTTVIHSCEKIKQDVLTDSLLLQEVNHIRMMLK